MVKNKNIVLLFVLCFIMGFKLFSQSNTFVWIGETEEKTLKTMKAWEKDGFKLTKQVAYDVEFKSNVTTYQLVSDNLPYFTVTVFKGKVGNYFYLDDEIE